MLTSIPVADFIDPPVNSRPWKALARATDIKPDVQLVGEWQGEKYFRVQGRGENRYCVIVWLEHGEPMAQCTCEAFYIPQDPTHCYHIGSVLIWEAEQGQET